MARSKRVGGPFDVGQSPTAKGECNKQDAALCIASAGCPLSTPAARENMHKKVEGWTGYFPSRLEHFSRSGYLVNCICKDHEGVQVGF